jgi:hypothetical protein
MKTIFRRKNLYWVGVIVVGTIVGISLQFVYAWVGPPVGTTPPDGNVGAPVVTGNSWQTKVGGLTDASWVQSPGMYAQVYYDDIDRNYYVDPNSTSVMGNVHATNWLWAEGSMWAPIYYDSANSGYYVDPNGSSVFSYGSFIGGGAYGQGGLRIGYHTLNSNSNGWLYVGNENQSIYGSRGIASGSAWVSDMLYLPYGVFEGAVLRAHADGSTYWDAPCNAVSTCACN